MRDALSDSRFTRPRSVTFGRGWFPGRHMVCAWIGITKTDGIPDEDVYTRSSASFVLER